MTPLTGMPMLTTGRSASPRLPISRRLEFWPETAKITELYCSIAHARVAELVDALVSGTSVRKDVQVRVLFRVPEFKFAQVMKLVDIPA